MKPSFTHPALVIFEIFRGQTVPEVLEVLEENYVYVVFVPSNCSNKLQPLDLTVNKIAKDHLRQKFHNWYAEKVMEQTDAGKSPDEVVVDMRLTVMNHPEIRRNRFVKAGIVDAISDPINIAPASHDQCNLDNPFSDLENYDEEDHVFNLD